MKLVTDKQLANLVADTFDDLNRMRIRQTVTRFIRACEEREKKMLPPGRIDATDHLPWFMGGKNHSKDASVYENSTIYPTTYCKHKLSDTED